MAKKKPPATTEIELDRHGMSECIVALMSAMTERHRLGLKDSWGTKSGVSALEKLARLSERSGNRRFEVSWRKKR